ncbi:MAG: sulfotransferase family protein [Acidimicrobiales bacterium]
MTERINIWSSPRNVSTALMYSWRQRPDTVVVDEPLYAHYLKTSGRVHPGTDEILAAQSSDAAEVIGKVILAPYDRPIVVFKQMAKHLLGVDRSFLGRCHNVLLTRDPHDMLTSFQKQMPDATLDDTGFVELIEILEATLTAGNEPIVIDSKVLLQSPAGVLDEMCRRLGVPFDRSMLSWPAGPKPEDGVWAKYWYDAVHLSTGWAPWQPKQDKLLPHLEPVLARATELYGRLLPYAIP